MNTVFLANEKGIAMTLVIFFAVILTLLAGYVLRVGYNQTLQIHAVSIKRTSNYYHAQSGIVDANWRIRTNHAPPGSVGSFSVDTFDPQPYFIDTNTNTATAADSGTSTVTVDIGPRDPVTGLRRIDSTGLDGR